MRSLSLICILFFTCTKISAQTYTGYIYDKASDYPLHMASVQIKHQHIGTATNHKGEFTLSNITPQDTIVVTHIGYISVELAVSALKSDPIRLTKCSKVLESITVTNLSAENIIDRVISKLPDYYMKEHGFQGFFREELYNNNKLQHVSEAELYIQFPAKKNGKGQIEILKKQTIDPDEANRNLRIVNGPMAVIEMNEVFARKTIFNKRIKKLHSFKVTDIISENDRLLYVITFQPIEGNKKKAFNGTLYINADSYNLRHAYIQNNTTKIKIDYKPIGDKYITSALALEKKKLHNQDTLLGKVSYVTTHLKVRKRKGKHFSKNETLYEYSDTYKNDFWINSFSLLPDTTLKTQIEKLIPNKRKPKVKTEPLYYPSASITLSIQSFNDLEALSDNMNNLNRLVYYTTSQQIKSEGWASLAQTGFAVWFSIPFQGVEAERRILASNNYKTTYNPFVFNGFYNSYCKGISNSEIEHLKSESPGSFLRFHTVRYETNFNTIKKIEEELFNKHFLGKNYKEEFLKVYFVDYFLRRLQLVTSFLTSAIEFDHPQKSELQMPVSVNKLNSYVRYLHTPDAPFKRSINTKDLTENEKDYLSQTRWLSAINLIPALTNLLHPIKVNKNLRLHVSGAFMPVLFGHQFEQNLYLKDKTTLTIINLRQYVSHDVTGFSAGIKLIDRPFINNVTTTFQTDYWMQPATLSFYDKELQNGFSINQRIKWRTKNCQLWIGYIFKTDGFIDYSTSLSKDINLQAGFKFIL